jgi:hypothetical protein
MVSSMLGSPKKPGAGAAKATPTATTKPLGAAAKVAGQKAAAQQAAPPAKTGFLMTGMQAKQAVVHEEARAQARQEAKDKAWRFWIGRDNLNQTHPIIFLDGKLDADGALEPQSWYEHSLKLSGKFQEFICTADVPPEHGGGPCPLCAAGNERSLMFGLTILDLTPREIKNGPRAGQIIEFSRKLFVCKKRTWGQLQVFAQKFSESHQLTSLRGLKFDVTRTGAMAPNVGDNFIVDSLYSEEDLVEHFGEDEIAPYVMEEQLVFRTPDELVEMGIAEAVEVVKTPGPSGDFAADL